MLCFPYSGPVELAAVGVSIAIFNQASKITIFPLVSITTSFVAEEETAERLRSEPLEDEDPKKEARKNNESWKPVPDDVDLENLESGSGESGQIEDPTPEDGTDFSS